MCTQSFASYIHSIEFEVRRRNGSKSEEEGTVERGGSGRGLHREMFKTRSSEMPFRNLNWHKSVRKNLFKNPKLF